MSECPHSWDLWRPIHYQLDLKQPGEPTYRRDCQWFGCSAYQVVDQLVPTKEPETRGEDGSSNS